MSKISRILATAVASITLLGVGSSLVANLVMLDFGPTTVTGAEQSNSPYHTATPGFTDTTWNKIETSDVASGILNSDGTAATGVSVNVGRSSSLDINVLTFAGAPNQATLGTMTNTGVFAGTSVGKDGIFYEDIVGVAIGGLTENTYEIYIVGANTNKSTSDGATIGFWAIATAGTSNLDTSSYLGSPQGTSTNSIAASWVEGSNYAKLTVTLTPSNPFLTIFSTGTTANEDRGFINSIQVSQIPESSHTGAALGAGAILLLVFMQLRRRKS